MCSRYDTIESISGLKFLAQFNFSHQYIPRRINPQSKPDTLLRRQKLSTPNRINLKSSHQSCRPNNNLILCKSPPRTLPSAPPKLQRIEYQMISPAKGDEIMSNDNTILFESRVSATDECAGDVGDTFIFDIRFRHHAGDVGGI